MFNAWKFGDVLGFLLHICIIWWSGTNLWQGGNSIMYHAAQIIASSIPGNWVSTGPKIHNILPFYVNQFYHVIRITSIWCHCISRVSQHYPNVEYTPLQEYPPHDIIDKHLNPQCPKIHSSHSLEHVCHFSRPQHLLFPFMCGALLCTYIQREESAE